ncbi:MAG: LysR family transcriptional regulator, partial [Gammaproteobacteria bacterium]|nr:LysR family transcriptional regulator [Gammaproteobacteria bacterium]
MNLRDLQYIIAVAETRHFGRAAERCFVSQPTLSGQIKKLEDELGVVIFERTNRSVVTTPAGEAILVHARQMIEQSEAIRELALAHQDPLAGPLRIGVIPTLSPYLMPLILIPLKQQHPDLSLVLSEEMTDVLIARLLNYEIDAAILATSVGDHDLISTPLFDEPFWVAYALDHPFYLKQKISKKDLKQQKMLMLAEGHCLADQTMELCGTDRTQAGSNMDDLRASSLETLIQFVAAGFGITLIPALA